MSGSMTNGVLAGLSWAPLVMVVIGSLLYHLAQKSVPAGTSPMLVIGLAYLVGLLLCGIGHALFRGRAGAVEAIPAGWGLLGQASVWKAAVGIGVAAFLIEVGYLLTYRVGWDLGLASVISNMAIAILLLPLGLLFFGERITLRTIAGVVCCLIGFLLLTRR